MNLKMTLAALSLCLRQIAPLQAETLPASLVGNEECQRQTPGGEALQGGQKFIETFNLRPPAQ